MTITFTFIANRQFSVSAQKMELSEQILIYNSTSAILDAIPAIQESQLQAETKAETLKTLNSVSTENVASAINNNL